MDMKNDNQKDVLIIGYLPCNHEQWSDFGKVLNFMKNCILQVKLVLSMIVIECQLDAETI